MSLSRSWQFFGGPGSVCYRLFDWLRDGVNARLAAFLGQCLSARRQEQPPACTLEAGSGPGCASSLLAGRSDVSAAVCMDLDIDALIEARRRDPTLPLVVGDLNRMPFADGAFSLVFNSSTVEHLDAPDVAVREMQRVCAADGHVFVGVPYRWGPLWFQPLIRNSVVGVWLGTVFTRGRLDRMLREAGLNPMAHMCYFVNFFVGALASKRPRSQVVAP